MDKFNGISRAAIVSTKHSYEVLANHADVVISEGKEDEKVFGDNQKASSGLKKGGQKPKGEKIGFMIFRYAICTALLLVCFLPKIIKVEPISEASNFIKDELSRDSISELAEIIDEAIS